MEFILGLLRRIKARQIERQIMRSVKNDSGKKKNLNKVLVEATGE
jgi:hypothetical protein